MFELLIARAKVTLLMTLFFLPIAAAAWNQQLKGWLDQNQYYEALVVAPSEQ